MVLLGLTDKAILTLFGPGLIEAFGLHRGTKLLVYKFMTLIGSMLMASLLKVLFSGVSNSSFLLILLTFSVINLYLGYKLWKINQKETEK